mgnify:CR=1 FL=1
MKISKIHRLLGLFFAVSFLWISCGSSDSSDEPANLEGTIHLVSQTIADGEEVDAAATTQVTLTYDKMISLNSDKSITLNGANVSASVAANSTSVNIPLALEEGQKYTLVVPTGAVCGKITTEATAVGVTLTFTTKEKAVITYNFDALTNSKATTQAKALYQLFRDNYGVKMFSGAMGGVAWETGYADYINTTTGKYPAIVGFDYIHLASSPANWINYTDIAPVKSVWDNNGIVQIGWHWRVPATEADYTGGDASKREFYSENFAQPFDINAALTEGTWQNNCIKADIQKIAESLKLLQDANIPVIFRPLHEAAGDYKWGAWFWWGTKGAELYKKLWVYLHDQLTETYGLNNLIWVYTAQASSAGNLASTSEILNWYPGDNYVDMVGVDLYFDSADKNNGTYTNLEAYNRMMEAFGGKKMIMMSECGRLPNASTSLSAGDKWGYFMTWYNMTSSSTWALNSEWDNAATLKSKMNDAGVLNRGDFTVTK